MMKPIIFNTEEVKAILDGRKTMTRRAIKTTKETEWLLESDWDDSYIKDPDNELITHCPFGQAGNKLWVKETFCEHTTGGVIYKADEEPTEGLYSYHTWRPSIHMPRWASRITLEITEVRVERLGNYWEWCLTFKKDK